MNKLIILIALVSMCSCAYISKINSGSSSSFSNPAPKFPITANIKKEFQLTDKAGTFFMHREKGYKKSKNQFIVKQTLKSQRGGKVLEKLVLISSLGSLKNKISILKPNLSEYRVWFDGKRYTTRMSVNSTNRTMEVSLSSPEKQWQGKRTYNFPNKKGIYCYFSQITECARATGFVSKAIKNDGGSMKVIIIWEGYPYFQEQYLNIPNEVFSSGTFSYDGRNRDGVRRFTLAVANQSIFYFLDSNYELSKKFWVSQGLSMAEKD